ncbi:hypothetical protein HY251_21075 [bacterium]|nr:hypothetical protein [bacterium]
MLGQVRGGGLTSDGSPPGAATTGEVRPSAPVTKPGPVGLATLTVGGGAGAFLLGIAENFQSPTREVLKFASPVVTVIATAVWPRIAEFLKQQIDDFLRSYSQRRRIARAAKEVDKIEAAYKKEEDPVLAKQLQVILAKCKHDLESTRGKIVADELGRLDLSGAPLPAKEAASKPPDRPPRV